MISASLTVWIVLLTAAAGPMSLAERVESLRQRLLPAVPAERFLAPGKDADALRIEFGPARGKAQGDIRLQQTPVSLSGERGRVLNWLAEARQLGFVFCPPFNLRSAARSVHLSGMIWHIASLPASKSKSWSEKELSQAHDNLRWFEHQGKNFAALLDLLKILADAETIQVPQASLAKGHLRVSAAAADPAAWAGFQKQLETLAAALIQKPRLSLHNQSPAEVIDRPGTGLWAANLDPLGALLLTAITTHSNLIAASTGQQDRLQGYFPAADAESLRADLLGKLSWSQRQIGNITLVAKHLPEQIPAANMFSTQAIDVLLEKVRAEDLLQLLADQSRLGLVPPAQTQARLTLAVRDSSGRQLAAVACAALGLIPHGQGSLVSALPPSAMPMPLPKDEALDPISLHATEAPLAELTAALAGKPQVIDCREKPRPANLHLRRVPAASLLALLLATSKTRLLDEQDSTFLIPAQTSTPTWRAHCRRPEDTGPKQKQATLLAVLSRNGQSQALIRHGRRLSWVRKGDSLANGEQVRRIRMSAIRLTNPQGQGRTLSTSSPEVTTSKALLKPEALPLAYYRLRATLHLPGGSSAWVVDRNDRGHLLRRGDMLGRRCARVTKLSSHHVSFALGCPGAHDPKTARLLLF